MSNTDAMKLSTPSTPRALPSDEAIAEAIVRHLEHRREALRIASALAAPAR